MLKLRADESLGLPSKELPPSPIVHLAPHWLENRILPEGAQRRIALIGDPGTGKTTLAMAMRSALHEQDPGYYPHLISANPDGQGQGEWYAQTAGEDPNLAIALRDLAKSGLSREFIERVQTEILNDTFSPVVLVDIGGLADADNASIAALCTDYILLSNSDESVKAWQEFIESVNAQKRKTHEPDIRLVAKIACQPASAAKQDFSLDPIDGALTACMEKLDATKTCHSHPVVRALATELMKAYKLFLPELPVGQDLFSAHLMSWPNNFVPGGPQEIVGIRTLINRPKADNQELFRQSLARLNELEAVIPEAALVLINGPMTTPIAVAYGLRISNGHRTLAFFQRDVGNYVVVCSPPDSQYQVGDLLDGHGRILKHQSDCPADSQPTDAVNELRNIKAAITLSTRDIVNGTLITFAINDTCGAGSDWLTYEASRLTRALEIDPEYRGALLLNGKGPLAVSAAIVHALRDVSARVAVFVPQLPGRDDYLIIMGNQTEIGNVCQHPKPAEKFYLNTAAIIQSALAHKRDVNGMEATILLPFLNNARQLSRTLAGNYDTSSSPDKPVAVLAGESLANRSAQNFANALIRVYEFTRTPPSKSAEALRCFVNELYRETHSGIMATEQPKLRTWSLQYSAIRTVAEINEALEFFFRDLSQGLMTPPSDRVQFAAEMVYRFDHVIHPFADGVGRISQLIGSLILQHFNLPAPQFESRFEYYQAMNDSCENFAIYFRSKIQS